MVTVVEWEEFATEWLVKNAPIDHIREAFSWLLKIHVDKRRWEKQREKIKKQLQKFSISYIKKLESSKSSPIEQALLEAVLSGYIAGIADVKSRSKLEQFQEPALKAILNFRLPPREAIQFWLALRILSHEEYKKLEEAFRPYAFTMALTTDKNMMIRMKNYIERGLREGFNEEEFIRRIRKLSEDLWREFQAPYLKTVFRTNLNTAMNAARWNQYMQDPFVEILVYKTMADGRVRPTHRMMHNFAAPKTDDVWKQWFPPNGYNCRCFVIGMSKEDWKDEKKFIQEEGKYAPKDEKWQWKPKETVPKIDGKPISPDPGFHNAPATFYIIKPVIRGLRVHRAFRQSPSRLYPAPLLSSSKDEALEQMKNYAERVIKSSFSRVSVETINEINNALYDALRKTSLPKIRIIKAERMRIGDYAGYDFTQMKLIWNEIYDDQRIEEEIQRRPEALFRSSNYSNVYLSVVHEIGHHLYFYVRKLLYIHRRSEWLQLDRKLQEIFDNISHYLEQYNIPTYARQETKEFFAEMFVQYVIEEVNIPAELRELFDLFISKIS